MEGGLVHRSRRFVLVLLVGVLAAVAAGPGMAAQAPPRSATAPAAATVTLVTGERVHVSRLADGRPAVVVEPLEGGVGAAYLRFQRDDDLYVVPSYVVELIPERLDLELFNVTELVEQGFTDDAAEELPTILTYRQGERVEVPSLRPVRRLGAIGADAARQTRREAPELGRALAAQAGNQRAVDPLAGVDKIWLDRRVEAVLDESVPQIGADVAREAGFDGSGVTVAVLDSGIDATHPDLAGRVVGEENFTESETTTDLLGHGTHVASIVAGSGAASDGTYTGVAPGASLLNGKVLDDFGFGLESWVIAGMEWAVAQGADVVNISLGGDFTDGTDPLSLALDQLSESSGTLFAVAAGNAGSFGVTNPGTASRALTVGAVDGDDLLADFSGTGPRLGDFAIKPDITGPGVDITAARAEGTELGELVGDSYVTLSGTSMATPHLAGAAAILAQLHPEWEAPRLKAALVASALPHPDLSVYQQGGGRVSVPDSLEVEVLADPVPLDLGYFPWPHDDADPVTENVTYTNTSAEPVNLELAVTVQDEEGIPAPSGMVTVAPAELTLASGGSADVQVTVDVSVGDPSLYGGYLTAAEDDGGVTRVPVGFYKEPERHTLSIDLIGRDGSQGFDFGIVTLLRVDEGEFFGDFFFLEPGEDLEARVPPGVYSAMALTSAEDGDTFELVHFGDPQFEVGADTTVTLDARPANEILVEVPEPTTLSDADLISTRESADGSVAFSTGFGVSGIPDIHVFAAPTETVTVGYFEQDAKQVRFAGPESLYDLFFIEPDRIPEDLTYQVTDDNVATVTERFYAHVPAHPFVEFRIPISPRAGFGTAWGRFIEAPLARLDRVSAGNIIWFHEVDTGENLEGFLFGPTQTYAGGEVLEESWYRQPVRPGWIPEFGPSRSGDTMEVALWEFIDADDHFGPADPGFFEEAIDTVRLRLFQNGRLVGESQQGYGVFEVAPDEERFRLSLDVRRNVEWWTMSARTRTAWSFTSDTAEGEEPERLPLLQVDYEIDPIDLLNRSLPQPGQRRVLDLSVSAPPGVGGEIDRARLWVSGNDGRSWRQIRLVELGDGQFRAVLGGAAPTGFLSLRVEARDDQGNRIRQDIIRAFKVRR
jgi:subtilisin family serine protease